MHSDLQMPLQRRSFLVVLHSFVMCQTHPYLCQVMNQGTPRLTFLGILGWWERNHNIHHWTAKKLVQEMLESRMVMTGGLLEIHGRPLAHMVITVRVKRINVHNQSSARSVVKNAVKVCQSIYGPRINQSNCTEPPPVGLFRKV